MSVVAETATPTDAPHGAAPVIVWFRQDLRLTDHRPLQAALQQGTPVICIYVHDARHDAVLPWGFRRMGPHRRSFLADCLAALGQRLAAYGQTLWVAAGDTPQRITQLANLTRARSVHCEHIPAPEEADELTRLRAMLSPTGTGVQTVWQSSLLEPEALPFGIAQLPQVFTEFRRRIEREGQRPVAPVPAPSVMPAMLPEVASLAAEADFVPAEPRQLQRLLDLQGSVQRVDRRSAFPFFEPAFASGETAALAHVERYFAGDSAQCYKQTRNGLIGTGYSTKFSPWLATGALSPRTIWAALQAHERRAGANDSTYWIGFELLWRDYFRFLHLQHGARLFRARGLSERPVPRFDAGVFSRWTAAQTGVDFIDAGMRELRATGYLSNRMRQNVASFWVNDLQGDWRAGAAWFESALIDYDVCSNQGNWLYVAGRGTDPRAGRRFDPHKQACEYDRDGSYRRLWSTA